LGTILTLVDSPLGLRKSQPHQEVEKVVVPVHESRHLVANHDASLIEILELDGRPPPSTPGSLTRLDEGELWNVRSQTQTLSLEQVATLSQGRKTIPLFERRHERSKGRQQRMLVEAIRIPELSTIGHVE
jgi:hypothetical protein